MELSMDFNYICKMVGTEKSSDIAQAVAYCKDAGFRYVDFSPNVRRDDWKEFTFDAKNQLEKAGITVDQTHAPFNRYGSYADDIFPTYLMRSFEAASILGVEHIVVHADEYRVVDRFDQAEIAQKMIEFYTPYVDYAKKNGFGVAVENLFEDRCGNSVNGRSRFTSEVEEVLAVIEGFHDSAVTCCWDFGHGKVAFEENAHDKLRQVGKYLSSTHVHDNYYSTDMHLLPFLGKADWEAYMKYLGEINYQGKFTFELVYGKIPLPLLPDFLAYTKKTGDYLLDLAKK